MRTLRITRTFVKQNTERMHRKLRQGNPLAKTLFEWRNYVPRTRQSSAWKAKIGHMFKGCATEQEIHDRILEWLRKCGLQATSNSGGSAAGQNFATDHAPAPQTPSQDQTDTTVEESTGIPMIPDHLLIPTGGTRRNIDTGSTNQLTASLRDRLQSFVRGRVVRNRDSGELDTTKLPDIAAATNLDSVFLQRTHGRKINAAVQILVDLSGSMLNDGKLNIAATLCKALGESIERLRIPVEIIGFSDYPVMVKPFHGACRNAQFDRLREIDGTNLPQAYAAACRTIAARREARHIQFIITDGDVGREDQIRDIRAANPRVESYTFGLGVEVRKLFHGSVDQVQSENMIRTISAKLLEVITRH